MSLVRCLWRGCGACLKGLKNPNIASGNVWKLLWTIWKFEPSCEANSAIAEDNQAGEELRFKYRYLDLDRPKMQNMLKKRAENVSSNPWRPYGRSRFYWNSNANFGGIQKPWGCAWFSDSSRLQEGKFLRLATAPGSLSSCWWLVACRVNISCGLFPRQLQQIACMARVLSAIWR